MRSRISIFAHSAIVTLISLAVGIEAACAVPLQRRCNGRVQYRPCETAQQVAEKLPGVNTLPFEASPERSEPLSRTFIAPPVGEAFARVLEKSFYRRVSGGRRPIPQGVWAGRLEGNGNVDLYLEVTRGGELDERRYMGGLFLDNRSTSFKFVSSLPKGSDWAWSIVTIAQ